MAKASVASPLSIYPRKIKATSACGCAAVDQKFLHFGLCYLESAVHDYDLGATTQKLGDPDASLN
jgi:hypothetical protein